MNIPFQLEIQQTRTQAWALGGHDLFPWNVKDRKKEIEKLNIPPITFDKENNVYITECASCGRSIELQSAGSHLLNKRYCENC